MSTDSNKRISLHKMIAPLNVLLLAPSCDGTDVGEALCAFNIARHLSERCRVTILTMKRAGRVPLCEQLPRAAVIGWNEPKISQYNERFNAMLKPDYLLYYWHVRNWLGKTPRRGEKFEIVHQVSPMSLRYPCPAVGFGMPVVVGPMSGSLATPAGFKEKVGTSPWFTRLRVLDGWRLRHDPWLRASLEGCDLILGGAPYVREHLQGLNIKQFRVFSELGVDSLPPPRSSTQGDPERGVRLLHVGRAVRTKGLRDCIRALSMLSDVRGLTLDVAGDGEELPVCRALAEALGVSKQVKFHGRLGHREVLDLYAQCDIFVFPSFREPTGGVIVEAMSYGLPVLTVNRGGPDFLVDETCGIKVEATDPDQLARDLANGIRRLLHDPGLRQRLGEGARKRIMEIAYWPNKIDELIQMYYSVASIWAPQAVQRRQAPPC